MKITGAVLCGGASSRMGRDKASLNVGGRPMIRWVVDALKDAGSETVVALGDRPDLGLPYLPDKEEQAGPLGAIIGAIEHYGTLMVCPCDVPTISPNLLREIATRSQVVRQPVVLAHSGRLEPLIGIYKEEALDILKDGYESGARGPKLVLSSMDYATVTASPDQVTNINTQEDFECLLPKFGR